MHIILMLHQTINLIELIALQCLLSLRICFQDERSEPEYDHKTKHTGVIFRL